MLRIARRAARFAAFLCVSLLLTVLFVEVLLRLFPQLLPTHTRDSITVSHPYLTSWYRGSLETEFIGECFRARIRFNELGMRNPSGDDLRDKERAWLFVGDSMVQGLQVANDALFTSLVQREHPDVAVINLSKSGSGPIFYNKMMRYFLEHEDLHPNIERVYYFIFMGNDFDNLFIDQEEQFLKSQVKKYLHQLRIFALLRIIHLKVVLALAPETAGMKEPFYAYDNELNERALDIMAAKLKELKEIASAHGMEPVVVLLPSALQMREGRESQLYRFPVNNLKKIADGLDLELYDAAGDMMVYQKKNRLPYDHFFFECDGHFNEAGHRLVAQLVMRSDAAAGNAEVR